MLPKWQVSNERSYCVSFSIGIAVTIGWPFLINHSTHKHTFECSAPLNAEKMKIIWANRKSYALNRALLHEKLWNEFSFTESCWIFWSIPFFFLSLCVLVLWLEFASLARVYYKFITHHISYMSHELNKGTCGKTVPVIQWTGWQIWLHKWFFELLYTSFHYLQLFLLKCFFFKEWFFQLVGGDHMKTKYPKSKSDSSLFMHNIFFRAIFLKFHECT